MKAYKKVVIVLLLVLSLGVLVACGNDNELAKGKTQINFWGWGD